MYNICTQICVPASVMMDIENRNNPYNKGKQLLGTRVDPPYAPPSAAIFNPLHPPCPSSYQRFTRQAYNQYNRGSITHHTPYMYRVFIKDSVCHLSLASTRIALRALKASYSEGGFAVNCEKKPQFFLNTLYNQYSIWY